MKLTAWDRAKVLKKTADLMRERLEAIARTLTMEQGKPLAESKAEILHSADTFEWFAEEGKRAYGQVIPNSLPGKRHVGAQRLLPQPDLVVQRIGDGRYVDGCKVLKLVEKAPFKFEDTKIAVTVSIGVASYPQDVTTKQSLIKAADAALYTAKHDGRNAVRVFGRPVA